MKSFQFRLARVLRVRESQARNEETKLESMRQMLRRWEAELAGLSEALNRSHRSAKGSASVEPFQLAALDRFEARVKREREERQKRIKAQTEAIQKQESVVVEARRKVELLNKLRERRHSQWEEDAGREMESVVSDFVAAEWNRRQIV